MNPIQTDSRVYIGYRSKCRFNRCSNSPEYKYYSETFDKHFMFCGRHKGESMVKVNIVDERYSIQYITS